MKKLLVLSVVFVLAFVLLAGCGGNQPPTNEENEEEENVEQSEEKTDVVTTASQVNDKEAFLKAISEDGTWIIIPLRDLEFDQELLVEGLFRDKGDPDNELYRKLAFYAQDEDHNVTERHTITAPKLTIKSPNTKLQGGIFEGDVYVEANGFTLQDAKVEGNVYFANEEYESSFDMSNKGEVTGTIEVQ